MASLRPAVTPQNSVAIVDAIPHRVYSSAQCIVFAGRRGQGKTYAITRYMESREPRLLAFDPFDDFGRIQAADPVDSVDEALADLSYYTACRRRVRPPVGEDSRQYAEDAFAAMIDGDHPLRDCLLVLDEMTLWTRPTASSALEKLVLQGRRFGIRMAIACQRISLLPGICLSEATELVVFRTTRPRDLDVLADWGGKELAEKAINLQKGEACGIIL